MLESKNTQFTLSAIGEILWQQKVNNPVPGVAVAVLEKGEHPLSPVIKVLKNEHTAKHADDMQTLVNSLKLWITGYMSETINALVLLEVPQGVDVKDDAVSKIAARVYKGMGIVPREELEDLITELTPETRADLRAKKIRLGPVLAFIPELNKPAAVRLRALLWSIFNGSVLPAQVPADGIVSVKIEDESADPVYYRSIGYPLYGGRAVRIDMLDRVISCVYDHADKGKFQARHEMAEWLGCPIESLYKVLESMGHTKIYDPAEQEQEQVADTADDKKLDEVVVKEVKPAEEVAPEASEKVEAVPVAEADPALESKPKQAEKPELATFRLKKGKAFASKERGDAGKRSFADRKQGKDNSFKDKKKPFKKRDDKKSKPKDRGPRVITAEAKKSADDSPFAILQQLKK